MIGFKKVNFCWKFREYRNLNGKREGSKLRLICCFENPKQMKRYWQISANFPSPTTKLTREKLFVSHIDTKRKLF